MSLTFLDLQSEVKRRATRDQSGTVYDTATKNLINLSILSIANVAPWKILRKLASFETVNAYSTGTVSTTQDSKTITFSGANLITNGVHIGRKIEFTGSGASNRTYRIATITGENAATLNQAYDSTSLSGSTYSILGQETYNLPIQCGRPAILWHEYNGRPERIHYVTDSALVDSQPSTDTTGEPSAYTMWGEDTIINQPRSASVITVSSSSASDTTQTVTVFGIVSGYPDFETLTLNGTSSVAGSKSFTSVERIVKSDSTVGRITATANSAATTVAVLPVGDIVGTLQYKKIKLFPVPDGVYEVFVQYYKDPVRLVNDNDIHELGPDFDELIILLAVSKLNGEQSKKDAEGFWAFHKDELKTLRRKNADKLDYLPRLQPAQFTNPGRINDNLNYSQIGSKYGPMTRF